MDDALKQTAQLMLRHVERTAARLAGSFGDGCEAESMGALLHAVADLEQVIDIVRREQFTTWTQIASMYPLALDAMPMLVAFAGRPPGAA